MSDAHLAPDPTSAPSPAPTPDTPVVDSPPLQPSQQPSQPLAGGGHPAPEPASESYWKEDWRQRIAEHASAGNPKILEKELRRLESLSDPAAIYTKYRDMENTWATRKFVKLPGDDAKPEEVAEYHKAMGVPEAPDGYLKDVKLENGAVIGDADKPMVESFAAKAHQAGMPPAQFNAALNWYYGEQQRMAEELDAADDTFKRESLTGLQEEFGPSLKRSINATPALFSGAPGGADISNPRSLYARLIGGRTADGRIIGDDPDFNRWLIGIALERNPAAAVVDDVDGSGKSLDAEIKEIEQIMRTDRRRYDRDYSKRYGELLTAREKLRSR